MPGVFDGLKVLDFCWVVIGPMTTRYFADYGGDVIRVESAHRPDVLRNGEPFAGGVHGINRSGYYANYNSSKRSLTLNLADDRARSVRILLRRVSSARIVVTARSVSSPRGDKSPRFPIGVLTT